MSKLFRAAALTADIRVGLSAVWWEYHGQRASRIALVQQTWLRPEADRPKVVSTVLYNRHLPGIPGSESLPESTF